MKLKEVFIRYPFALEGVFRKKAKPPTVDRGGALNSDYKL
jgi:hypothetical protein